MASYVLQQFTAIILLSGQFSSKLHNATKNWLTQGGVDVFVDLHMAAAKHFHSLVSKSYFSSIEATGHLYTQFVNSHT